MTMEKTPEKAENIPLMLRLPPDIHEWVKESAQEDLRSLNSQVVAILRDEKRRRSERLVHWNNNR